MSKLPKDHTEALVRMAQNGMHSGIAKSLEVQVRERVAALQEAERRAITLFLRSFPEAVTMAGHRVFDLDALAELIETGEHLRCLACGGEGGGGSMDPDVWFECDVCKGKGRRDA
jgi:hypothetical protein